MVAGWEDFAKRIANRQDQNVRGGHDDVEIMKGDAANAVPEALPAELKPPTQARGDAAKAALAALDTEAKANASAIASALAAVTAWQAAGDATAAQQQAVTDGTHYVDASTAAVMARVAYVQREIDLHAAVALVRPAKAAELKSVADTLTPAIDEQRRAADAVDATMRTAVQQRTTEAAAATAACASP